MLKKAERAEAEVGGVPQQRAWRVQMPSLYPARVPGNARAGAGRGSLPTLHQLC